MGLIETVIILSLYVYAGDKKTIDGWYHQENIGKCLEARRIAERNSGEQVQYTCTLEQCEMTIDKTGVKHCDKILD